MPKTLIDLVLPADKVALAAAHECLEGVAESETVELHLQFTSRRGSPLDYGRVMQFILTWGHSRARLVLRVDGNNFDQPACAQLLRGSDMLLLAAALADRVIDAGGNDASEDFVSAVDKVLEERVRLGDTDLVTSDSASSSIFLPAHLPRLAHSPNLHAQEAGKWKVGEEARTLYHTLWPEPDKPISVRDPWSHLGEERFTSAKGVHYIRRNEWPLGHEGFQTLAERTVQPRGLAREHAIAHRVRDKPPEDEVGEVLYELVQNTEWHALSGSASGRGLSFRVLHFAVETYSPTDVPALSQGDPTFAAYLAAVLSRGMAQPDVDRVKLGVVTIIDSGIGLARSAAATRDELHLVNSKTEIGYLGQALSKTTRTSLRAMGNVGLPRVQVLMTNLRGFMTIRTGTVELRRDFINNPIKSDAARPLFIEWIPEQYDDFNVGARVGTDVTIIFPVDYPQAGTAQ